MNKKTITLAALVLVVALIGGIFWYTNQPVPVEGPAEDEEITANSEPAESTPEAGDSEAEENTPETEGDSEAVENDTETEGDGTGTGPLSEQLGLSEDMTEEEVQQFLEDAKKELEESASSVADGTNQQQGQGQGQGQQGQGQQGQGQQGQGQGQGQQSGGKMTQEEVLKRLQEAGMNPQIGAGDAGKGSNSGVSGSEVHW